MGRSTYEVDDGLICGQVPVWRPRKAHCALNYNVTIGLYRFSQLCLLQWYGTLLCEPKNHLVAHKDAELLFQLALRFRQTSGNRHDGAGIDSLGRQWTHQGLKVGCKAEGNGLSVTKKRAILRYTGDKFGAPYAARSPRDGNFVREAYGDVHDVCNERKGGVLIRELASEKPE